MGMQTSLGLGSLSAKVATALASFRTDTLRPCPAGLSACSFPALGAATTRRRTACS